MLLIRFTIAVVLLAVPAHGDVPKVVTDIAPVQSLVATVMQGLGSPGLIVGPNGSPHGTALRPSQARALHGADLVVWIGPELTPWLEKPLENLASGADRMALLEVAQTHLRPFSDGTGTDPHAWLDPLNGQIWLKAIASRLAQIDPDNAAKYQANAVAGQAELAAVHAEIAARLVRVQDLPYVSYHDAYRYFEARFGLKSVGAVTSEDEALPGPAELARLGAEMEKAGVRCAFSEAEVDPGLLYAAAGRDDLKIVPMDPLGRSLKVGPGLYIGMLRAMSAAFVQCAVSE